MTFSDQIFKELTENKIINDYFAKISPTYIDDFKQHIYCQIYETYYNSPEKIELLLKEGKLGKYINGIISNQLKSNTSSFAKLYYNLNLVEFEDRDIKSVEEPKVKDPFIEIEKIIIWLQTQHPADAILFKLHFGICPFTNTIKEPMSFKEMQTLLNIPYQTIQKSCLKTKMKLREIWK